MNHTKKKKDLSKVSTGCFWCGSIIKDRGTKEVLIENYEECPKCKAARGNGIKVIGVVDTPTIEGQPPIITTEDGDGNKKYMYPTGNMFITGDDYIRGLLDEPKNKLLLGRVLENRLLMLPDELVSFQIQYMKGAVLDDEEQEKE